MKKIVSLLLSCVLTLGTVTTAYASNNVKKGDVNSDGKINAGDITKTAAYIKGIQTLSLAAKSSADVNSDGKINAVDITQIAAHIKGIKKISTDVPNDIPVAQVIINAVNVNNNQPIAVKYTAYVYNSDTNELIANENSDENGVIRLVLPRGKYDLKAVSTSSDVVIINEQISFVTTDGGMNIPLMVDLKL